MDWLVSLAFLQGDYKLFRVIIIGAGPAGSTLASLLSNEGVDVILFEKEKMPGVKPCAGFFPLDIEKFLPFSIQPAVLRKLNGLILKDGNSSIEVNFTGKPIALTRREVFDSFLLKKAQSSGAKVYTGEEVIGIDGRRVGTKNRELEGDIICFADGFASLIKKRGIIKNRGKVMKTISGYIDNIRMPPYGILDFSFLEKNEIGYFWCFPGENWASVGFGSYTRSGERLENALKRFLKLYKMPFPENSVFYAYAVFNTSMPVFPPGIIGIGDAINLPSPSTGGGIFQAVKSAYLAFKAIINAKSIHEVHILYRKYLMRHMFPDLFLDQMLGMIFYNSSYKIPLLKIGVPIFRLSGRI